MHTNLSAARQGLTKNFLCELRVHSHPSLKKGRCERSDAEGSVPLCGLDFGIE
jgi:hypothetical protein